MDFQASQWGSRHDVRFTVNVWVGVAELADTEADAQVQERVGHLLPGGQDHWWSLDAATDTTALADELRHALQEWCLPWLEARRSLNHLMDIACSKPDEFPRYALGRFQMLLERSGLAALASEVPPDRRFPFRLLGAVSATRTGVSLRTIDSNELFGGTASSFRRADLSP